MNEVKLLEVLESFSEMTALCRLKYGNLDPEIWKAIQKAEGLIAQLQDSIIPGVRVVLDLRLPPDEVRVGSPERCNEEVFKYGTYIGVFVMTKAQAEAFCKAETERTGYLHDWYFIAGRVHVKALIPKDTDDEHH